MVLAATKALDYPMFFSLNRNYQERFDSSIESGSDIVMDLSILDPIPNMEIFLSNSQPMAPDPT
jgi:hypothetical protein